MALIILLVQIGLPLALISWVAFFPRRTVLGGIMQAAASGAVLFALAHIAQWAVPVWWLPRVYGALWLIAAVVHVATGVTTRQPRVPSGRADWLVFALSTALFAVGGWFGAAALAGRMLPPVTVVDVANPFGPGHYLVGSGGSTPLVNAHMRTLDARIERFRPWRGQSYAVDFFGLGPGGLRARGWRPADPADYAIFGAKLYGPCDGIVMAADGTTPDYFVPQQDTINRLGNFVIVKCGDAEVVLAHMRQGSVTVAPGDTVTTRTLLGEVGNSGATSEPHLHIHAQRAGSPEAPIAGDPLALTIEGRFLVRGDRIVGRDE